MKERISIVLDAGVLRKRAEEQLKAQKGDPGKQSLPVEMQRLIHELQVHQIELEMQNDELLKTRTEAEAGLDLFTDLYDFAPVGYVTLDRDGTIHQINLTGAKLLGKERSRLIGGRFTIYIADAERPGFDAFLNKTFTGPALEGYEARIESGGDSSPYLRIEAIAAANGNECRMAIFDITERRRIAQDLERHTEKLAAVNKELEAFSYSVAHDLRNPLAAILANAEVLAGDTSIPLETDTRQAINHIATAAERMAQVISDLMVLSNISRTALRHESVNLGELASGFRAELAKTGPGRNVEWVIPSDLIVNADPGLMKILMQNLIRNAWKFSSHQENARIEVGSFSENEERIIFVRDNGVGFDVKDKDKLFKPFHRLHSQADFKGTGIGLALVKRIVSRHGGIIWAEGEKDKGATIYFSLS